MGLAAFAFGFLFERLVHGVIVSPLRLRQCFDAGLLKIEDG